MKRRSLWSAVLKACSVRIFCEYFVNVLSVFQKHDVRKNVLIVYCVLMFAYSSLPRFWHISDETGLPFYVRIYPYADVFTKEVDMNRENEYSAYGR